MTTTRSQDDHPFTIRPAIREDCPTILRFIQELALFEKEPDAVEATVADLERDGFGEGGRYFEALIAEDDRGEPVGFALFFPTYSTWKGRSGLYIEDLYVTPQQRTRGVGRKLVERVMEIARERRCGRLELAVLDWNPARAFYDRLGFQYMQEWLNYRIEFDG
ncbi:MAG: GNAT family N-acetyltransferase [Magnetococcales bacterium]|nr:GNAT family N-acetyltransferase [Magnetococcales bacterium]